MSILHTMTDEERAAYKAQKINEIRDYNRNVIEDLGISPYDFNMKTPFKDSTGKLVVGIFASEFKKPKGFSLNLLISILTPLIQIEKFIELHLTIHFMKSMN